ncbi:DUF1850 domain-containing protein [Arenibaculum pallidiluteum]|uniref:DUF1850 domain-containing protein n=1 Tax=Arenibaculum pallidiluteum TaxID=2812559 RepID=UPI001A9697F2|nr:DUF1850 domain-containing protein [Arenibaculum pallidiluteum]
MSLLCVVAGGAVAARLALEAGSFTLSWTHSIEKTAWWERWVVEDAGLRPVEARITGSGPGMDPPEGGRWEGGFWTYRPSVPPQPSVTLANSSNTADYTLCARDGCGPLARVAGGLDRPVTLLPCAPPS